jgi:hypothetical protein
MWSISLCYCNNGNINRRISQTQLQYPLEYLQTGKTQSSFESNHSTSITIYGATTPSGPKFSIWSPLRTVYSTLRNIQWVSKTLSHINPVLTKNTLVFLFGLQVNTIQYNTIQYNTRRTSVVDTARYMKAQLYGTCYPLGISTCFI